MASLKSWVVAGTSIRKGTRRQKGCRHFIDSADLKILQRLLRSAGVTLPMSHARGRAISQQREWFSEMRRTNWVPGWQPKS